MPRELDVTRRRALAALGTAGVASAGAGLGTTALFGDRETFTNDTLVAGSLDATVALSAHYADRSPDEGAGVAVRAWDGPPATTGGPDDLAPGETGLPTDAAWLVAVDDPERFLANTRYAAAGDASCPDGTDAEALDGIDLDLTDVKPGDFGAVTVDVALCDTPAYLWLRVDEATADEGTVTEPEADDPDEDQLEGGAPRTPAPPGPRVELLDAVRAACWVDDGDGHLDGGESLAATGTLREVVAALSGLGLSLAGDLDRGGGRNCFSAGRHSVGIAWWLPADHANEVQTDSVSLSLTLAAEQCRHNDGAGDPLAGFLNDDALYVPAPVWDGTVVDRTGESEVTVANNALIEVALPDQPPGELPLAYDPLAVRVSPGTTVRWTWLTYEPPFPPFFDEIPHNVVALGGSFDSGAPEPAATADEFTHTFGAPGTYPYYCTPHGAPFLVPSSPGVPAEETLNEFGMRGAVVVEG